MYKYFNLKIIFGTPPVTPPKFYNKDALYNQLNSLHQEVTDLIQKIEKTKHSELLVLPDDIKKSGCINSENYIALRNE